MPSYTANLFINKKSNNFVKVVSSIAFFTVIILCLGVFSSPIKNVFSIILSPLQKISWNAGGSSSSFIGSLLNAGNFSRENQQLKEQNRNLLAQLALLQQISGGEQEKDSLRVFQESGFDVLMAGVTGLEQDVLSIDKGLKDGLKEGMPVINQQNVLFGKIYKVSPGYSQIMLLSNKNSVVNVKTYRYSAEGQDGAYGFVALPKTEVDGVLKGAGGLKVYLDLVPVGEQLNQGDVLLTSALENTFPKNLLVGAVQSIKKNDQKPFQQAEVNAFMDIKNLDNLFVITNYKR